MCKTFVAFIAIAFFTTSVSAENWKDPEAKFDATKRFTTTSTIQWITTDDLQKTCDTESRDRGHGGFSYPVDACSFWKGPNCVIYTKPMASLHDIGHEMRHCFQGNYH